MDVGAPRRPTSRAVVLPRFRDRMGQVALVAAYLMFAEAQWRNFRVTGHVTGVSYLLLMLLVVAMAAVRRPANSVATSWSSRLAATIGTYGSLLLRPGGQPLVPDWLSAALTSVGIAIAILGLISLRRSFGLLAAHRGVVEGGMYQVVRHPLYAGYVMSHLGVILSSPTPWNVVCWLITDSAQVGRIHYEEQLLSEDPQYVRYQRRVRWRLVPGVF